VGTLTKRTGIPESPLEKGETPGDLYRKKQHGSGAKKGNRKEHGTKEDEGVRRRRWGDHGCKHLSRGKTKKPLGRLEKGGGKKQHKERR